MGLARTVRRRAAEVSEEPKQHSRWVEEASDSRVVNEDAHVVKVEAARTAEHHSQVQPICSKTKMASPRQTQLVVVDLWHRLQLKQHSFHRLRKTPKSSTSTRYWAGPIPEAAFFKVRRHYSQTRRHK